VLGVGAILLSILVVAMGLLAVLLKQIMDRRS
jgi:polyisoprenyl-phosphate glycosyltransferase